MMDLARVASSHVRCSSSFILLQLNIDRFQEQADNLCLGVLGPFVPSSSQVGILIDFARLGSAQLGSAREEVLLEIISAGKYIFWESE